MTKDERTSVVCEVENEIEGRVYEDLLQEAGIPAMVSPTQDVAFNGMDIAQRGWGRVIILTEDLEAAQRIIKEYQESLEREKAPKKRKKKDD